VANSIRAFVGYNGGGKTLAAMVLEVQPALDEGREVVATCAIADSRARLLESWREMTSLRGCLLLLDDISSQLPSRGAMQAPAQLVRASNQLRKQDVRLVWTAPNWARADVMLREVTQEVTVCKGYVADRYLREAVVPSWRRPWARALRGEDGQKLRSNPRWPPNSLFRWTSYRADAFDEFTLHAVRDVRPVQRLWYWRPWHGAQFLYNTEDVVELLDHVDEVGVCIACGGTRRRPACSCSDEDRGAARLLAAVAAQPGRPGRHVRAGGPGA
jgi:hypothetical protein